MESASWTDETDCGLPGGALDGRDMKSGNFHAQPPLALSLMQQPLPLRRPQAVALGLPTPAMPLTPHRGPQAAALEAHRPLTQLLQVVKCAFASLAQALHSAARHAVHCLDQWYCVTRCSRVHMSEGKAGK